MNLRHEWFQEELRKSEESLKHRPLDDEYSFLQAVSSGDMDFVEKTVERMLLSIRMAWAFSLQIL